MLFIEALAHTMVILLVMAMALAYGFAGLERAVRSMQARIASREASSLDEELRDLGRGS